MPKKSNKTKRKFEEEKSEQLFETYKRRKHNNGQILGIDFTHNKEQQELIRLINQNNLPIIVCTGAAGTGKTFATLAAAIDLVKIQRKYSKIIYLRNPLEVGNIHLGYLPGDIDNKYGVYLGGLEDNLDVISEFSGINKNDMKASIECIPPQFARGHSWTNSIIIVDEAQDMDLDTIQTLATRIGKYCKIIFLGSMNQIDIKGKGKDNNDFLTSIKIFESISEPIYEKIELIQSERSEYCKLLDEAFQKYKDNNKK